MKDESDLAVFVYGSLQPGGRYWARYCEGKVVEKRPAQVRGRLFGLGDGFPAIMAEMGNGEQGAESAKRETGNGKPETESWVKGWWMLMKDEAALAGLDQLENYQKGRSLEQNDYERVRVMCFAESRGTKVECLGEVWTYVMTPERIALENGMEVPSGQWVEPQE